MPDICLILIFTVALLCGCHKPTRRGRTQNSEVTQAVTEQGLKLRSQGFCLAVPFPTDGAELYEGPLAHGGDGLGAHTSVLRILKQSNPEASEDWWSKRMQCAEWLGSTYSLGTPPEYKIILVSDFFLQEPSLKTHESFYFSGVRGL